ncbi:MAG: mechanosensitive ion channel [Bacteroidales bacterium]
MSDLFIVADQPDLADKLRQTASDFLFHLGFSQESADLWDRILIFLVLVGLGGILNFLLCRVFVPLIQIVIQKTGNKFLVHYFKRHFLRRILSLIPPILLLLFLPLAFSGPYEATYLFLRKMILIFIYLVLGRGLSAAVNATFEYYNERNKSATTPYRSVFEMMKLIIWSVILLFVASTLMEIRPIHVITGLSAFAAILILVFRDTLLGFVAGIQLAHNKMVKLGDWIQVPDSKADGFVTDINILTLQVRNFDNTYVYVPAYDLVTKPFLNWAGMEESGVWRVNETIPIDAISVIRPDQELLDSIFANPVLKEYIGDTGYQNWVADKDKNGEEFRTNLGIFRRWIIYFLANNSDVTTKPYQLVRVHPLDGTGIPLQIFFFLTTISWLDGWNKQASILEQLLSVLPYFGLRQFQFDVWQNAEDNPVYKKIRQAVHTEQAGDNATGGLTSQEGPAKMTPAEKIAQSDQSKDITDLLA